jgi:hypothetical protein
MKARHAWLVTGIHSSSAKSLACEAVAQVGGRVQEVHIVAKSDAVRTDWGVVREVGESSQGATVSQTANSGCMRIEAGLFGIQDARRWSERRFGVHTGAESDEDVALKVRYLWQAKENQRDSAKMVFRVVVEDCLAIAAVEVEGVQSGKREDSRLEKVAGAYLEDMLVAAKMSHWHYPGCMPSGEAEAGSGHLRRPAVAGHAVAIHFLLARSRIPVWSLSELRGCHLISCSA